MRRASPLIVLLLAACAKEPAPPAKAPAPTAAEANAALTAHAKAQFPTKEVLTPVEGVHVALGYGLANAIWLEGPAGAVLVDALGNMGSAREAKVALQKVSDKPLKAVVLTHNHADHVFGTRAFLEGTEGVPVVAHETTSALIAKVISDIRPVIYRRSMRMFGVGLPADRHAGCGIGPFLDHDPTQLGLVEPTRLVKDRLTLEAGGLRLEVVHAPGETDDQLFVWWPDKKALFPGDNFYQAFPNLYTIRGTAYRDVKVWVRSLDRMLALEPEVLVPSHTRPIVGKQEVRRALTDYRDAIQYVHDQTVRGMNRGLGPDALVAAVQLPAHLVSSPYLAEHYGTVAWSVRSIFAGYLGWFDGNPTHLHPLDAKARAERWQASLPKGTTLRDMAQGAVEAGDLQWAAELLDLHRAAHPADEAGAKALADVYEQLAAAHVSANGRNYYAMRAGELRGAVEIRQPDLTTVPRQALSHLPASRFLSAMPVFLDPAKAEGLDIAAHFRFTDEDADYTVHVRRGVAVFRRGRPDKPAFTITTTSETWKGVVLRRIGPAKAALTGDIALDGDVVDLVRFLGLFDRP